MVGKSKKRRPPRQRGSPIPKVPPPRRRESPRRSGSSFQEYSDDRVVLPSSPQAGNEGDTGNIHVSPHDESLDSQVDNDVASDSVVPELLPDHFENDNKDVDADSNVNDNDSGIEEEKEFCKCHWRHIVPCNLPQLKPLKCTFDGCNNLVHHLCQIVFEQRGGFPETMLLKCCLHHPQSPFSASKPPPVNDPEEKLHLSTASNSKTSMADSSGHPNDAVKKAAGKAASSSSDESSSSDDSSEDSSNDREDGASSAPTPACGKNLALQSRFGQGKQLLSLLPPDDDSSEDSSNDRKDGARSATTPA
jgi:hypothetical protein